VHRAFIMADTAIEIPSPNANPTNKRSSLAAGNLSLWIGTSLADAQRELILATLDHFNGDKQQTAQALGVSLKTLYNRLQAYQDETVPGA